MKKQILFLTLFSLALIFAGTKSYGQDIDYTIGTTKTPAVGLNCASGGTVGHLNPTPGINYEYIIETDPATVASVLWFVTDDEDVIAAGGALTTTRDDLTAGYVYISETEDGEASEDDVYDNAANVDHSINITWNNFDGSDPDAVLLVAYVTGVDGCSDNIEVWRIEPIFLFTLDVLAMEEDGDLETAGSFEDECVSPVYSALYNLTELAMDYGQNYVYFSVTAANFVDSWMPDISAVASNGAVATDIYWAYPSEATVSDGTGTWNLPSVAVVAGGEGGAVVGDDGTVGDAGEYIIVRVLVDHGNIEAPVGPSPANDATVILSIDGIMYDATNTNHTNNDLLDVDDDGTDCVQNVTDQATHLLLPRPDINENTPGVGTFEPKI